MIPSFNRAHFLPATIESVLAQSFDDFDLTIVDDASTDNTEEVVRPFLKDSRVKTIRNQTNQGLTKNWNLCLALAGGPLVQLLLSDDLIDAQYLSEVSAEFELHPELGLVAASCRHIDRAGNIILPGTPCHPQYCDAGDEGVSFFLTKGYPHVSSIVFRKLCVEVLGGYNAGIWHGPDVEFDVRVASRFPTYHFGVVRSSFRRHGANSGAVEFLDKRFLETDRLKFSLAWQYLSKQGALKLGIRDVDRHVRATSASAAVNGVICAVAYGRWRLSLYYLRKALELNKRVIGTSRFWKGVALIVSFPASAKLMQQRLGIQAPDLVHASRFDSSGKL